METIENCFECSGINKDYQCYNGLAQSDYCTWKMVADTDLIKYKNNNPHITLKDMLDEYIAKDKQ